MSTNHSIPNPLDSETPFTIVNFSNITKLTPLTYQSWFTQINSILYGYDLLKYVDGSYPCPPATIPTSAANSPNTEPNPAHFTWLRQDKLILGALLGTLSPTVATLVVRSNTSREVWTTLKTTYANPSRGHILQIKDALASITKTTETISDYMQRIKECTDKLALLDKPMDIEDITAKILSGLDYETYKPVIDSVRARDDPISFEALHEKLIHHDLTIKQTSILPNPYPVTANAAFRGSNHTRNQQYRPAHSNYTPSSSYNSRPPYSSAPPSSANTPFSSNQSPSRCQWCQTQYHSLHQCHKFKRQFPDIVVPIPTTRSFPSSVKSQTPHAHTATIDSSNPSSWLLDSGATHHITNDLNNLSMHNPYDGTDELVIGDGSSLPIAHIGYLDEQNPSPRST